MKTLATRRQRLLPLGQPRWVRLYDNGGKTADQYTVVFTGRYPKGEGSDKRFLYLSMSGNPCHPQGVCLHGTSTQPVDAMDGRWPPNIGKCNHLGKRILWYDLPKDCKKVVLNDYKELWDL